MLAVARFRDNTVVLAKRTDDPAEKPRHRYDREEDKEQKKCTFHERSD